MRIFAYVLIGLAAAATVLSLIGLGVDLDIARLFFDPAAGRFAAYPALAMLRDHGYVSIATGTGFLIAALAARLLPQLRLSIPGRAVIFLAGSLALGPGLLVNVVFKDHWHRPRPVQVVEFGGGKAYVDWWNPTGACETNCSFASGETASAAWMAAPAMLAPAPWRAAALVAVAIFTATISLSRMSVGAHFFTDVVFGALMAMLAVWAMYALMYDRRRTGGES
ncbi:MAG: phosphatase PAP2 family protein [Xanthobacteraceae bacterium]